MPTCSIFADQSELSSIEQFKHNNASLWADFVKLLSNIDNQH